MFVNLEWKISWRNHMRRAFISLLAVWLIAMSLVVISCSKKEKSAPQSKSGAAVETPSTPQTPVKELKPQTTDAISGNPINRRIYTDYEGFRIYFCCVNSQRNFEDNPERYLRAFRSQGVQLEKIPTDQDTL